MTMMPLVSLRVGCRHFAAMSALVVAVLCIGFPGPTQARSPSEKETVLVFAAASLKNAMEAVKAQWEAESGKRVSLSFAASSTLAKQIEQAAPADIFISADLAWMDYLATRNLIKPDSRGNLLRNRIVLIAPKERAKPIEISPGFDLASHLGSGRLAMANVDSVPAGRYGKAALEKLGVWAGVAGNVAQADNVRAALLLVSRGEAPLGIVYQTDAAADRNVSIVGTFPEDTHPPIVYPIALTVGSRSEAAVEFLNYIKSARGKPLFEAKGFTVIGPGGS
jgi:molybdate transport system substrate-binding protein